MLEGLLWTEKYRPDELDDLALSQENEELFRGYLEAGEIPHLLLYGPAGCGKTTVSRILMDSLDCATLKKNASSERGIDLVRGEIGTFVRGRMGASWNIVFLDEADALTPDAQTAMRALMERNTEKARFILTANYPRRIIDPIRSRCAEVGMREIPLKRRAQFLAGVLQEEGVEAEPSVILSYGERYTDMRRLLTRAQKSLQSHGELRPAHKLGVTGEALFKAVRRGDYTQLKEWAKSADFDHRQALVDLFEAVPDDYEKAATFRMIAARAHTDLSRAQDPVVHILGTFSELIMEAT